MSRRSKRRQTQPAANAEQLQAPPATRDELRAELNRFMAAFGVVNGSAWFIAGKPFEECQRDHAAALAGQLAAAESEIARLTAATTETAKQTEQIRAERDALQAELAATKATLNRYRQASGSTPAAKKPEPTPATEKPDMPTQASETARPDAAPIDKQTEAAVSFPAALVLDPREAGPKAGEAKASMHQSMVERPRE